jgi:prepilin-type N-terminal cleavage/methylation domain-containing protein
MKKGFTLIELLAVIVILAIIAVIAVPIVLNIIDETKENANKRSIDMYAKALEISIASYKLNGNSLSGSFTTTDGKTVVSTSDSNIKFEVDYTGSKVVCNTFEIYEDGKFYIDDCKVDNSEKEYSYGEQKIFLNNDIHCQSDIWKFA